jgi:thiol-disulfide isomerase/thioredoxin
MLPANGCSPVNRMRKPFVTLLAALAFAAPSRAAQPGDAAPAFSLPAASGAATTLASLRGSVVYVDFWASWCTPCRRSFPWMNALQARYGAQGLAIVAINVDKRRDDAERFLRDTPAQFAVLYDAQGIVPSAYDVREMPSSFLIDRNGTVVLAEQGFRDERKDAVEARIRELLAKR